jgi:hypothetical protein
MYIEKSSVDSNRFGIEEDLDTFLICIPPSYRPGIFPSISWRDIRIDC